MKFELHTIETAPEPVRPELQAAQQAYGAIPNLYRGFAASPACLKAYLNMNEVLNERGSLSPVEQQVVYLTVSAENGCAYCMGAHSTLADMLGMPQQTLAALREQTPLEDARLDSLRRFTLSLMEHRGHVPQQDLDDFGSAGYDQGHLLEVLTILAQKTLSNYYNHITHTPLDAMFEKQSWQPPAAP